MNTQSLLARRSRVMGKQAPLFYDEPLHIVKGEGVWLYAADGTRYLDVYNNVPNVGHCHPHVVKALTEQAHTLNVHTRYLHQTIVDYSERLLASFAETLSMLILTCTGSEADDVAMRMAREHTGGMGIICTDQTYHGNTTAVDELATLFHQGQGKGPHVKAVPFPDSYRPLHDLAGDALADAYIDQVRSAIAAFQQEGVGFAGMLVCPIFANEGVPDVPPGYLQKAAHYVREAGGLLIFDEVQSGFGRTGSMWGYEAAGVVPDIVTLGKPMGNGHPIAGVVAGPELINGFRQRNMYFNTFGGNPVSCAVANAVLDVIEQEKLVANARDVGAYLRQGLLALQARYELIGDVRNRGLFFGVELVRDRNSKEPAADEAKQIVESVKQQGALISKIGPYDNVLKMRPPIVFSTEHADILLTMLDQAFASVA